MFKYDRLFIQSRGSTSQLSANELKQIDSNMTRTDLGISAYCSNNDIREIIVEAFDGIAGGCFADFDDLTDCARPP